METMSPEKAGGENAEAGASIKLRRMSRAALIRKAYEVDPLRSAVQYAIYGRTYKNYRKQRPSAINRQNVSHIIWQLIRERLIVIRDEQLN